MGAYFTDFAPDVLDGCLRKAYNADNFHTSDVVDLRPIGRRRFLLELYHGPTAAFKDVALQLMPQLTNTAKAADRRQDPYADPGRHVRRHGQSRPGRI